MFWLHLDVGFYMRLVVSASNGAGTTSQASPPTGIVGTNPFTTHGKIVIDARKGAFGDNAALQAADFQAAASKLGVGLIANKPQAGGWYSSTTLKPFAYPYYPYVNRRGITQFRLRFQTDDDNDAVADLIRFYSGNATATNRPVLVITYTVP